jgi:hypothetical protein
MSNLTLDLPTGNTGRDFDAYYDHIGSGRKIGHNTHAYQTTLLRPWGRVRAIGFRYHATTIARWAETGLVVLDSGGWRTSTTKHRLCLIGRRLGFAVSQRRHVWYLYHGGREEEFYDGIATLGHRRCAIGCECGAQ